MCEIVDYNESQTKTIDNCAACTVEPGHHWDLVKVSLLLRNVLISFAVMRILQMSVYCPAE